MKSEGARERKRRQRQREREGLAIYRVEAGIDIGEQLARRGLLHPSVADQPEAIERALTSLLRQHLADP